MLVSRKPLAPLRRRPGAARRLRCRVAPARSPACWAATASARRRCCAPSSGHRPISGGSIRFEGQDIARLKPFERAALGIAYVPQGREIFPLLTVKENLETGFAPLKRGDADIPDEVFELFPVLKSMLGRRGGDLSGGQQQQLAIGRALVMRPRLLVLDEPTEGIQPSIIKDIGRAISYLRERRTWRSCSSSSISTLPATWPTASSSWSAARSSSMATAQRSRETMYVSALAI